MNSTQLVLSSDIVVIGLPLRTSPERAAAEIPAHWQAFMGENVGSRVSARRDDGGIYAVYCDYESDCRGAYTMVLGVAVDPSTPVPEGLRRVRVPAGRYVSFSANGNPAEVIWKAWGHVNSDWKERDQRRYIADYERYAPGGAPTFVEADVVVGLS